VVGAPWIKNAPAPAPLPAAAFGDDVGAPARQALASLGLQLDRQGCFSPADIAEVLSVLGSARARRALIIAWLGDVSEHGARVAQIRSALESIRQAALDTGTTAELDAAFAQALVAAGSAPAPSARASAAATAATSAAAPSCPSHLTAAAVALRAAILALHTAHPQPESSVPTTLPSQQPPPAPATSAQPPPRGAASSAQPASSPPQDPRSPLETPPQYARRHLDQSPYYPMRGSGHSQLISHSAPTAHPSLPSSPP